MRSIARLGAGLASLSLVATGTALAVTPADAVSHDPIGLNQGATWLAGQVSNGFVPSSFGGPDYGLSIDTAFALRAAGGHDDTVTAIGDALRSRGTGYLQYAYSDDSNNAFTGRSANATAKAMALLRTLGSGTTVGTINVQQRLESLTADGAPIAGRLTDVSTKNGVAQPPVQGTKDNTDTDFANSIGQAFAAYALDEAGSPKADDVRDFLLKQQCPGGGFRLAFTPSRTATAQSCTSASAADVDTTAIVLHQLNQTSGAGVAAARTAARGYLTGAQKTDGSWGGGTSTESSNANSTGLAATALGDTTPETAAVEKAAAWLRARQATYYDVCDRLGSSRGAVAYDQAALLKGRSEGLASAGTDQFRRATAQALPALAYLPVDTTPAAPRLSGPTGYLKAGAHPVLTVTGVSAGDQLCLNGVSTLDQFTASGPSVRRTVTLPGGTHTRVYNVRDAAGHLGSTSVKVLGPKTLTVTRTPSPVKRSRTITVAARGLAPNEAARIYYGRRLVRSHEASASGNLVARFSSGTSVGRKSIRAYGRFSDIRRGATSVRVVR